MKKFNLFLIATGLVLFFFSNENGFSGNSQSLKFIKEDVSFSKIKSNLESGDVILRSGKGFVSDVFRQFSINDKKFSHAGIICVEQGDVFVYHLLGGETDRDSQLRKELLGSFCNSKENNSFAAYRYDLTAIEKKNMLLQLHLFYDKKVQFDTHFDMATDSAMYCTELVYKVVEAAASTKPYLPVSVIKQSIFVSPDNLYLNTHARLIYSHTY